VNLTGVRFKKIFLSRPFTRAVAWGRAYKIFLQYLNKNEVESGVAQVRVDGEIRKALSRTICRQLLLFEGEPICEINTA
jgi:hypothetical protein